MTNKLTDEQIENIQNNMDYIGLDVAQSFAEEFKCSVDDLTDFAWIQSHQKFFEDRYENYTLPLDELV